MIKKWQDFWEERIKKGHKLHFTLFDPEDYTPREIGFKAKEAAKSGTDGIMIGGSTVKSRDLIYKTTKAVLSEIIGMQKPIILFPNSAESVCEGADCVFFMTLLNSRKIEFLIGEQFKGAPLVKKFGIEPVPLGYIVISTSDKPTTVEIVGNVDRITEKDIDKIINYALTAECLGMKFFYVEAGSGAQKPVSDRIISAIKKSTDIYIIVGGGIKTPEITRNKIKAGADIIVTTYNERLTEIIKAVHGLDRIVY